MSFLFGRQRQLAYDYRLGVAKTGMSPVSYFALILGVFFVAGSAGVVSGAMSAKTANKASAQTTASLSTVPKLKFSTQPQLSPIGDDRHLDDIIANFAQGTPQFKWSVAIQGLGANKVEATYSADQSYSSASIYKLLLIYPLNQKLPFNQWSVTNLSVNGHRMSIQDCAVAMLKVSDNACAIAVGNWVGWSYADTQLKSLGLTNTTLNKGSGPITTASDTTKVLGKLWDSNLFGNDVRQFTLDTLSHQTLRNGIPAGCPGCNVADKTGDLDGVRHDAGIIYAGDKSYILSVFTSGASYDQIAQLTEQVQAYMTSLF